MHFNKISLSEIPKNMEDFLRSLPEAKENEEFLPVYVVQDPFIYFVHDFKLPASANKQFEKESPPGLYRGGATIKMTSSFGTLVIPDERFDCWRTFGGMAKHSEGLNLTKTGKRELIEEVFVYSLDKKTRFVPMGAKPMANKNCSLGFTVENILEIGQVKTLGYELNERNKALEAVLWWNISPLQDYSISLEEDWFSGGRNGISVYAWRSLKIRGVFSGQQGFIEFSEMGIHETLGKYL